MKQTAASVASRFKPGQSGNPGGRPKQDELHVSVLARRHTRAAIEALVKALNSPRERVPAAIALLDRGFGKPVAMIAVDPDRPIAVEFQWSDAAPTAHTDTRAVRQLGDQVQAAIIEAVAEAETDDSEV